MRLVIHAGMHKTGTSTIQNIYANGTPSGLGYFPWYGPNHTGLFIVLFEEEEKMHEFHGFKLMSRTSEEMKLLRKEWLNRTREFISTTDAQTLLFSAEGISGPHSIAVHNLANFSRAHFEEVKVISYVRPPLSFMASAFQEAIKESLVNNFDIGNFWPFYRSKISLLDDAFGKENVVLRKFDADCFIGGDLVTDFSTVANIPLPLGPHRRSNESLSLEAISALYTQRTVGDGFVLNNTDLFSRNMSFVQELNKLGSTRFRFSSELLERARLSYPGDLEWAEERMGVSLGDEPPRGSEEVAISCENDLYDVTLGLADKIDELRCSIGFEEEKERDNRSLIAIARKLDDIRRYFYSRDCTVENAEEVRHEVGRKMVKLDNSTEMEREIRMKIAYAILWAQERSEYGAGNSDIQSKWANEMASRMMDADQVLFMLRQQGLEVKLAK